MQHALNGEKYIKVHVTKPKVKTSLEETSITWVIIQ
jgi:hypothetical protein